MFGIFGKKAAPAQETAPEQKQDQPESWLSRLRQGLGRSSSRMTEGIAGIFTKRRLDDQVLQDLEDLLVMADLGPATAAGLVEDLRRERFGKDIAPEEVRAFLAERIAAILASVARPLKPDPAHKPHVILVVGVNGAGKTTTIGKLAAQYRTQGKKVMIAAGDTFRAAAVDQLKVWGQRAGVPVIAKETGADATGLAFEALEQARKEQADILLVDTAGRLQNRAGLMAELQKVVRVLQKQDPQAPHSTVLVLDATTGQNALSQVKVFREMVAVNGLVLTKLDGSARGGIVVAIAREHNLPVHAVGVGEGIDDLHPFDPQDFARLLVGL
ncbi:MAG: signal recognition particle-docking protein FtsY [Pseudomonadota bacterium]|nr:signal recognition particle-docking protein FtsY [Pseudomonadota bacterium]